MRLPSSAHTSRPWRIHALTRDFRVEDVWALPTPGGPDDFPRLVAQFSQGAPEGGASLPGRVLWAIRWKLGALLGWDDEDDGLGGRVRSLRERLPADLRETAPPKLGSAPFTPVYVTDDEYAAEIANRTMHGVLHLGWVEDAGGDGWHAEMAVLVKPNGVLGQAYMLAIRPFRHTLVYPPLLKQIEREWQAADDSGVLARS